MKPDSLTDEILLKDLERAILKNIGGQSGLEKEFPKLIRRALDEVIDTPRTGRLMLDEIEKTEKTYIGTKIEILFRNLIGYPKGILDLSVDGVDVDIKNTVTGNWMIPNEAIDKPCILIEADEDKALCWIGIIVARLENLTVGKNQDKKRSISKAGYQKVHWLLDGYPYPPNFWKVLNPETAWEIFQPTSANERLRRLFIAIQQKPVPRAVVEGVAQQKDYMKRLRKNGGARDLLSKEGIVILSGAYDKAFINQLGLPFCSREEFISYKPSTVEEKTFLKEKLIGG